MKLPARLALACIALLTAFALTARGQTTIWLPTSGTANYWDSNNWDNGLPNIALGYFNPPDDFNSQFAHINTASTALVTVTNATADQLFVGQDGSTSALRVESGGVLTANLVSLGADSSSTGHATVTGTGSTIAGSGDSAVYVGSTGTGSLTISSGGMVTPGIIVGWQSGSVGTVLVTGADSSTTRGLSGGSGDATITVTDHASASRINGGGSGGTTTITVSDYATVINEISGGGGGTTTITVTDHASVGGGFSGGGSSSTATSTVTITNGATLTGVIDSSNHANSDITFLTGGTLQSGNIYLHTDGAASVTFDGGNHTLATGLWLSGTGTNSILAQNGAYLNGSGVEDDSVLGYAASESGSITLTGEETIWVTAGDIYVGDSGTGTLNVLDQAGLGASHIYLGHASNGLGVLTVDGGGTGAAIEASALTVGYAGYGVLDISGGGTVGTNNGAIGSEASSTGLVTITGPGSQWTVGNDLTIGSSGGSGFIALTDGGTLTLGGGDGSLYLNNESGGTGSLNIGSDAGSAAAAAGFLNAAGIYGHANGMAVVVFNHTEAAYFFDPVISGGVFVVQKSGGTILNGANDYTGGSFISGGTLALGHDNAIGSGDIIMAGGTFDLNGHTQAGGTLTVMDNSFIDFSGVSTLALADSSSLAWSGAVTLLNFNGGEDSFQVGVDGDGLTPGQLALINIGGFIATMNSSGFLSASSTVFVAPVPEPATYAAALATVALIVTACHRRKRHMLARRNSPSHAFRLD